MACTDQIKGEELSEECSMHGVLLGKKESLGIPRLRCEYNIKMDL